MYYFSGGDDVEAGRGRPLLRRHKERHVLVLLIGNKPIEKYLTGVKDQCNGGGIIYGGITELNLLYDNLKQNAVPDTIFEMTIEDYQEFLMQRRVKMAKKMRDYYKKI